MTDVIIIGAGLTGLASAFYLQQAGLSVHIIDQANHIGGVIQSRQHQGFVYECGPNTGVLATPEAAELLSEFPELRQLADESAARRLILKAQCGSQRFHPLPTSLLSGLRTPLFSLDAKLRLLSEPFREAGTDPQEALASLVRRRLGEDFLRYAVDPFIGGIYAGDPEQLVTRFALPKLYALEQNYGSFIRGALAKRKESKSPRERLATRAVFSCRGGLGQLPQALAARLGEQHITLGALEACVQAEGSAWRLSFKQGDQLQELRARHIISTAPATALPQLFSFISTEELAPITALRYAPVVQIAWALDEALPQFHAFGGLVPSHEDREVLGILNPGACFPDRVPSAEHSLLAIFLGGMRAPEVLEYSDEQLYCIVADRLKRWLGVERTPSFWHIHRYPQAIAQYEGSSEARLARISALEAQYPGLHLAGSLRDGIGMADRIKQAAQISQEIARAMAQA